MQANGDRTLTTNIIDPKYVWKYVQLTRPKTYQRDFLMGPHKVAPWQKAVLHNLQAEYLRDAYFVCR